MSYWQAYKKVFKANMTLLGVIVSLGCVLFAADSLRKKR